MVVLHDRKGHHEPSGSVYPPLDGRRVVDIDQDN